MRVYRGLAAALAALSIVVVGSPASAAAMDSASASKLRQLDIMLMVSALRCRHSSHGFQADYYRFSEAHLSELNGASRYLEKELGRHHGATGAKRALDKMSVAMANTYGQGHPDMDCEQLKIATRELASNDQPGALLAAADRLLMRADGGRVNLAARGQ